MKFIMRQAISMDEESLAKEEGLLSRLWAENKVRLLLIYLLIY